MQLALPSPSAPKEEQQQRKLTPGRNVTHGRLDVVGNPLDEERGVLVLHVQHLFIDLPHRHPAPEHCRHRQVPGEEGLSKRGRGLLPGAGSECWEEHSEERRTVAKEKNGCWEGAFRGTGSSAEGEK